MAFDTEGFVRGIVAQIHPGMEGWQIVSVGDIVSKMPPRLLSMEEMIDRSLVDGYEHHVAGDDIFIDIGTIHLRRPR